MLNPIDHLGGRHKGADIDHGRLQMAIRLAENFRAVFYAPFYGCLALGFFDRAGLDIELVNSPSPGVALDWLSADRVDIVWSGPQRAIKHALESHPEESRLKCFGEVAAKDPFYLVARPSLVQDFNLNRLKDMQVSVVSEVPTPWFCLQKDLLDNGIDPTSLSIVRGLTMADQLLLLERAELDVIQVFEPYVQQALDAGVGQIVFAAADRGWTAYTTLMSTQQKIDQYRDQFETMGSALQDFSNWLNQSGVEQLVDVVKSFYPDISASILLKGLTRYLNVGLWSLRPTVSREGYNRLLESMLTSHTIARAVPYEQVVADFAREN